MTIERKVGMGIAGQPSGSTDVAEVFSTDLYTGNSGTNVINNGIDLAGEGGLVWFKCRNVTNNHYFVDTERGASKLLYGPAVHAETSSANSVTSFNSNGFTLGTDDTDGINKNTRSQVSWTFRKKSGFFDCVTWTGNGVAGRTIAHSLGCDIGMLIIKRTNASHDWTVYHKGLGNDIKFLELNTTSAEAIGDGALTSTTFKVNDDGWGYDTNVSGGTYVAYVFADNSAEDAEDQMIKCGSFTGNGSATGPVVNLGWEPQFLITKVVDSNHWNMWDSMRGITAADDDARLYPNLTNAENTSEKLQLTPTGFQIKSSSISINTSGVKTIYMAIRAPMMKEPEAATDVFSIDDSMATSSASVGGFTANHVVDFGITKATDGSDTLVGTRLLGDTFLTINTTDAESANSFARTNGYQNDFVFTGGAGDVDRLGWMWKRAKGYFDVVTYSGNATSGRAVPHSLGVAPEMMWVKSRDSGGQSWRVYHASLGATHGLNLNGNNAAFALTRLWNDTAPTNSSFIVGDHGSTNDSSHIYIAYLFATLPGISKVGSFVGNGTTQTIDCGFSAGARFLLIKGSTNTQNWLVFDTVRGIVARPAGQPFSPYAYGLDAKLQLDNTSAQFINVDFIDPHNSGFIVNAGAEVNGSGVSYIFYAIA